MSDHAKPDRLDAYPHRQRITTRWHDNDIYGHVNNVVYYAFFDTAVNTYLIEQAGLDISNGQVIGLVVESHCNYFSPVGFPQQIIAGVRVEKLGNSSVRYEVGIFGGDESTASAQGHFVHVFVDRDSGRPVAIPEEMRHAIARLQA
ncbi:MAG: hypothetical protein RL678_1175 [Pseudomonadota bacterium]